jgi:outer membrane biogenesis lipoprotein LolB
MKAMVVIVVSALLAGCASSGERCRGRGASINPPVTTPVSEQRP